MKDQRVRNEESEEGREKGREEGKDMEKWHFLVICSVTYCRA